MNQSPIIKTDTSEHIYRESAIRSGYEKLTKTLIAKGLTFSTMESCTSGQIASLITDTEGASAVLKGAFITYSNTAKIQCGVPADVIETYGVYSRETSREMALAAYRAYHADYTVGVTGSMGNVDPVNADSVPGEVFFSIAKKDSSGASEKIAEPRIYDFYLELAPQPTRLLYKLAVAQEVLEQLLKLIKDI